MPYRTVLLDLSSNRRMDVVPFASNEVQLVANTSVKTLKTMQSHPMHYSTAPMIPSLPAYTTVRHATYPTSFTPPDLVSRSFTTRLLDFGRMMPICRQLLLLGSVEGRWT